MNTHLIDAQALVNSFLDFLPPTNQAAKNTSAITEIKQRVGSLNAADIPDALRNELPVLFTNIPSLTDERWRDLYNGDTTGYDNDRSSADLALAGYLARNGLTPDEIDQVMRASVLYREKWDSKRGDSIWLHQYVISRVSDQAESAKDIKNDIPNDSVSPETVYDLARFKPQFIAGGMPPRIFAGPTIKDGLKLYPLRALSAVVALGAVGKHPCL